MDRIEKLRKEGAPWKKLVFDYVVITIASFVYAVGPGSRRYYRCCYYLKPTDWFGDRYLDDVDQYSDFAFRCMEVWAAFHSFHIVLYCDDVLVYKSFDPCGRGYHGSFAGKPCRCNPDGSIYGLGL